VYDRDSVHVHAAQHEVAPYRASERTARRVAQKRWPMPPFHGPRLRALGVALAVVSLSVLTMAASARADGWSAGNPIDLNADPQSISCPTTTDCVAVGGNGVSTAYDGTSWAPTVSVNLFTRETSVSCPTTTFCATVDSNGNVYTYDGTSWSAPTVVAPNETFELETQMSCASATFCVLVDPQGNA
jgi:hypothetical protein